jgi:ElaB/YqjD/DUF883 family membrane-anchored ribosome-binding protein
LAKEKETQEIKNIEEYVKDLRKDVDKRLSELKVQMDDVQEKAAKTVTEKPMLALGVAFVAGMAFGIALSRAGD